MAEISSAVYKLVNRRYWRRKGYERLKNGGRKRKTPVVRLASSSNRRRRFWRIKLAPRLKLKLHFSPKKFLIGLRDAYVNMMMRIANARMIGTGFSGNGVSGFGVRSIKEYDERMIVEIYKTMVMAQGHTVPRDAAWICSEITCRR